MNRGRREKEAVLAVEDATKDMDNGGLAAIIPSQVGPTHLATTDQRWSILHVPDLSQSSSPDLLR